MSCWSTRILAASFSLVMAAPHFLQFLHRTGWEFWLPLPLIAGLIWAGGHVVVEQTLSRPSNSVNKLEAGQPMDVRLSMTILALNAEIDRSRGVTTVVVKSNGTTLKQQVYEFPTVQANQIEMALGNKLAIPVDTVRKVISYQIKN